MLRSNLDLLTERSALKLIDAVIESTVSVSGKNKVETRLQFRMAAQPDDVTCGATCLHSIYNYYQDEIDFDQTVSEVVHFENGGTFGVMLGVHALKRGYQAKIYTYNLQLFDPTWLKAPSREVIIEKLKAQNEYKRNKEIDVGTRGYLEFLELGGKVDLSDLTPSLIRNYLKKGMPIIAGLSSTYLYRFPREFGPKDDFDDVRGEPSGHFVVLCGYDTNTRRVLVADPYRENPISGSNYYEVSINRLICSIMLGVLTYDANLLIIKPKKGADSE